MSIHNFTKCPSVMKYLDASLKSYTLVWNLIYLTKKLTDLTVIFTRIYYSVSSTLDRNNKRVQKSRKPLFYLVRPWYWTYSGFSSLQVTMVTNFSYFLAHIVLPLAIKHQTAHCTLFLIRDRPSKFPNLQNVRPWWTDHTQISIPFDMAQLWELAVSMHGNHYLRKIIPEY